MGQGAGRGSQAAACKALGVVTMHVILLRFAGAKDKAAAFMDAHKAWIDRGFEEGAFVFVGTLQPGLGGVLIAPSQTREAIEARLTDDPFVAEGVVTAEILDIAPARVDERIALLSNT